MNLSNHIWIRARVRIGCLAFFLAATLAVGCVDLNKPKVIQECAATHTCSDAPKQEPGPDSNQDTEQPGPDLQSGDTPTANTDLVPDRLVPDAPADRSGQNPDTTDATGTDGKEAGISTDADGGLPPVDSRPDLGPDTNRQDLGPDLGPDLRPDLALDLRPDLGPDLAPDLRPDLQPDLAPDLGLDTSPDTNPLLFGLLVYYNCDGATDTTLQDFSGNGNHGTLVGGTAGYSFPAGKVGKALALAKAGSGYVSVPPAVFAKATDITIAFWLNITTSQSWPRVFDVGVNAKIATNPGTGTHYMNLVPKDRGSNLVFGISKDGYNNEQQLTTASPTAGTWKHVAVVLGAGQGSLYIDGAVVSSSSTVLLRPTDLGTIDYAYLGKSQFSSDPYLDGQIDEFRVYGRALSAAEIQALYQFTGL